MAHRILTQIVLVGGRVLGRAFAEAWRQASASSKYAQQQARAAPGSDAARTAFSSGMTLDEACKVLNVRVPKAEPNEGADLEPVMERFKRLFDANDPKQGGSFYLQSKILRARERLELEVREAEEIAAKKKADETNPVYKGRKEVPRPPPEVQQSRQRREQQEQRR